MTQARPVPGVTPQLLVVFALLVAIGVVGRWGQPDWCVTPLAAIGLLAGYTLPRWLAIATPLAAMAITDLVLPSYGSAGLAVAVYAAMAISPVLGRLLRSPLGSARAGFARLLGVAACPALVFFLITNLAVWATSSMYAPTLAGLGECYASAVPFLRRMLAGDLAFTAVVFASAWIAGAYTLRGPVEPRGEAATESA